MNVYICDEKKKNENVKIAEKIAKKGTIFMRETKGFIGKYYLSFSSALFPHALMLPLFSDCYFPPYEP